MISEDSCDTEENTGNWNAEIEYQNYNFLFFVAMFHKITLFTELFQ